ncbi:MAG: xanthine dehydrogenase family protein subunit M, partial [Thermoproteota archaeon]
VLERGEILVEVEAPKQTPGEGSSFKKLVVREGALAIVSAAALVGLEGGVISRVRVALGAVAPTPVRARSVEEFLIGREPTPDALREASELARRDVSPITDVRGSREYREDMAVVMTRRALEEAVGRALRWGSTG